MKSRRQLARFAGFFIIIRLLSSGLHAQLNADFHADHPLLKEYVLQALDRNPALQGALSSYRAALQKVPQATALPDPMVQFTQFLRSVETRVGPQENSVMVSQKFPWFGTLDLKGNVAFKEASRQYQGYRALERDLIARVKSVFYELSYLDQAIRITREEQSLLEHYEALAQARYSTGQGLQQAVIKLQAEITKLMNQLKLLGQLRSSLAARLMTLMDRSPDTPVPSIPRLPLPEVTLSPEELVEIGERNRPELQGAMASIEKGEQMIELAKKAYWPDLTLSAGFVNIAGRSDPAAVLMPPPQNGKNAFNLSVGVNIPIHREKYSAGVLEATERLIGNRKQYLAARNDMEFSIQDQVLRLETLRDQVELFEQLLIPQAQEALRSTESAYQTGQVGGLELLDAERTLLQVRLAHVRHYSDSLKALSELERSIGSEFPKSRGGL